MSIMRAALRRPDVLHTHKLELARALQRSGAAAVNLYKVSSPLVQRLFRAMEQTFGLDRHGLQLEVQEIQQSFDAALAQQQEVLERVKDELAAKLAAMGISEADLKTIVMCYGGGAASPGFRAMAKRVFPAASEVVGSMAGIDAKYQVVRGALLMVDDLLQRDLAFCGVVSPHARGTWVCLETTGLKGGPLEGQTFMYPLTGKLESQEDFEVDAVANVQWADLKPAENGGWYMEQAFYLCDFDVAQLNKPGGNGHIALKAVQRSGLGICDRVVANFYTEDNLKGVPLIMTCTLNEDRKITAKAIVDATHLELETGAGGETAAFGSGI